MVRTADITTVVPFEADDEAPALPRLCVRKMNDTSICIVHEGVFTDNDRSRMPVCDQAAFDKYTRREPVNVVR